MRRTLLISLFLAAVAIIYLWVGGRDVERDGSSARAPRKLRWFIPDGMRADPKLFNIYRWAEEGKLPNLKRMMERGSYGFCRPTFPGHTPTNFATLFTGAYPEVHGINDGPMRTEGRPLGQVSVGGFSSLAKRVEPIWVTLEKVDRSVALLSIPGSTPPELKKGVTIRGRWGGWGADFHAITFQDLEDAPPELRRGKGSRLFFSGPELTRHVEKTAAAGWKTAPRSFSPPLEARLEAWGAAVHALITDSTDDGAANYDAIAFSADKETVLATLGEGAWSDWLPIALQWKVPGSPREQEVKTSFKIKVIRLSRGGSFRVHFFYSNVNEHLTEPREVAGELIQGVGPMLDFPDNFPPQLIFCPEDKATFLEESALSLAWHRSAAAFILERYRPEIFIHDTYTPNQMLTSRWWMGYIDPSSARYGDVSEEERGKLWQDVLGLYQGLDAIAGEILDRADEDTVIVLTSDHGAVPLDRSVRINNLFAREKLLSFRIDPATGDAVIDWEKSQAVYLQMFNVYVNPDGLGGEWKRAAGPRYDELRGKVRELLLSLEDGRGVKPIEKVVGWERLREELHLLPERAGDLVLANRAGYGFSEDMTEDQGVFSVPLVTGYKQAVLSEDEPGMWAPFIIVGPGVKKGQYLGDRPVLMVDQYPTILSLLGVDPPKFVQGSVLSQVLVEPPALRPHPSRPPLRGGGSSGTEAVR